MKRKFAASLYLSRPQPQCAPKAVKAYVFSKNEVASSHLLKKRAQTVFLNLGLRPKGPVVEESRPHTKLRRYHMQGNQGVQQLKGYGFHEKRKTM